MNQISDPPNNYRFGLDFNYAVWTAETRITLCNVPWNNDYRDIVKFDSRESLDKYIDEAAVGGIRIDNAKYARANVPVRVNVPYNVALRHNYLRATNPPQPIQGGDVTRSFYYFITDVRYIAPNTTELVVQLDVWQTYGYDVTFGNCYIERGHIGIANENQMNNYGRDYLTVPEGLDVGSEYKMLNIRRASVMETIGVNRFSVLVASTVDLLADPGTVDDPKIVAASGDQFSGLPSGAAYYVFQNSGSLAQFLTSIRETPWVGQGIISITVIPNINRYYPDFTFLGDGIPTPAPVAAPGKPIHTMFAQWREHVRRQIPSRYRHLSKLLTHPYMTIEMTTWSGTPISLKPESWYDDDATIDERVNLIPPAQRMLFMPRKYNGGPGLGVVGGDDGGEYLDFATFIQAFPTVALVNNMSSMYLASNAHMVAFQHRSADWTQQRALGANQTSYDQASSAMNMADSMALTARNLDIGQTGVTNRTIQAQSMVNAVGGVGRGGVSGGIGGPAGMAIGAGAGMVGGMADMVNASIQQGANTESLSMRDAANIRNIQDQLGNAGFIRDTNKSLADWAARGDYANTIAGINAKVQDSQFVQPTTSGQVGGDTMNLVNGDMELSVRWKFIDNAALAVVGEYWLRYGYAVRRFKKLPSSLQVMSKFTYWKLTETYISAAGIPESMKQAIRGLFEKGVTVWTNPDDIGNIDIADNMPLEGITL